MLHDRVIRERSGYSELPRELRVSGEWLIELECETSAGNTRCSIFVPSKRQEPIHGKNMVESIPCRSSSEELIEVAYL